MNEVDVGRVLPASLHQGIAEVLPTRLEFYEGWISPQAMRDRRVGLAAMTAVMSFLRQEGDAYAQITGRAGEYTAEWTVAELSAFERACLTRFPAWVRARVVGRLMRRLTRATGRRTSARVRLRRREGVVEVSGSLFCAVREPVETPLCEYYAAALRRLLARAGLEARVDTTACRASGAERCRVTFSLAPASTPAITSSVTSRVTPD
jgi:bacteriochlorophyll 4-vinyl reductase